VIVPRMPKYIVVTGTRERDGVTTIVRAYFAYSKPKLSFVNGGWVVFENETGNGTSVNVRFVESIHRLDRSAQWPGTGETT